MNGINLGTMKKLSKNYFLTIIFLVTFGMWYTGSKSQTISNVDSLKQVFVNQKDDSTKIETLLLIAHEYSKFSNDSALKYFQYVYELSHKLGIKSGIIDAFSGMSEVYIANYQFDSSLNYVKKAIKLADESGDIKRQAQNYAVYGKILYKSEGPSKGLVYFKKSYNLYKQLSDSLGMSDELNGMGVMYSRMVKYDSAVYCYLELISICEKLGFEEVLGKGYINLGIAYYELKNYDDALPYFEKSLKINEKYGNMRAVSIAYINLGNIAYLKNDFVTSMKYLNNALDISKKIGYKLGVANAFTNIGNAYELEKNYQKAFDLYAKAKDIYKDLKAWPEYIIAYKNIALIYERRKDYDKALMIYDTCLALGKQLNALYTIREIYYNIYKTYELKQDYKNAYKYLLSHDEIKDSIFNLEKSKTIADLQIKYDNEKNNTIILGLENDNLAKDLLLRKSVNKQNVLLFSGSGLVLVLIFFSVFYHHKSKKDKIISEQKIKQLEEEKKFFAARAIVEGQEEERKRIANELHDGLGVLLSATRMQFSAIKDKNPENKPLIEKATKLLEQASTDVRKISHNMMPGLLTKFGLYEAIEDLFDQLETIKGLNATIKINGEQERLPENKEIMLYRIMQEVINNTLKHAQANNVSLIIDILPNRLTLLYTDDGKGFDLKNSDMLKSIGVTSIQSRVNFLGGKLDLKTKPGEGVKYKIEIPLENQNKL